MNVFKPKKIEGKQRPNYFSNCNLSKTNTDGRLMAINDKYLTMAWQDSGVINLVNPNNPSNLGKSPQLFSIEKSNILDMEFSPFDNNILSLCYESGKINIIKIKANDQFDESSYNNHSEKANFINFNPVASNMVCSGTTLGVVHVWDTVKFKNVVDYKLTNSIYDLLWSPNGSLFGISTSDRYLDICDPRNNALIFQYIISENEFNSKFVWLDNDSIASIEYNKKEEKVLNLFDIRQIKKNPYSSNVIDKYYSPLTPFVDPELKIIYTIGKDDKKINLFDYSTGSLQRHSEFIATEDNILSVQLRRKYLNKNKLEIDKFVRYTKNNKIDFINFYLKEENLDCSDIYYPNEIFDKPQMTFEEWQKGKQLITQRIYNKKISDKNKNDLSNKKPNTKNQISVKNETMSFNKSIKNKEFMGNNNYDYVNSGNQSLNQNKPKQNFININSPNKKVIVINQKNEIESLKKKLADLEKINQNWSEKYDKLQKEKDKIIKYKDEMINQYSLINKKLDAENKNYKIKINENNTKLEINKKEIEKYKENNNKNEIFHMKFVNKPSNDNIKYKKNETDVEKNIYNLKKEIIKKTENEYYLNKEKRKKNQLIDSKQKTISNLEEAIKNKDNIIKNQQSKINFLEEEKK